MTRRVVVLHKRGPGFSESSQIDLTNWEQDPEPAWIGRLAHTLFVIAMILCALNIINQLLIWGTK